MVIGACSAQPEAGSGHPAEGAAVQMDPGELTYMRSCSRCHGADRMGKVDAPKLDAVRIASLGEQPLRMTIQYGKGRMEGFGGLTQQQVDDLVVFLRGR